ncbi:MAG: hypothetical protein K2X77_29655 [Candidatus Obscuribacterales bacterium]|jgi:proteasome lid subunit RPN8/RPN11|nr:hypothetical protein [Candidatus Obscuribacterales bacterium]
MSNYSDHQFRQLGHHSCDKELLWGYATDAETYRRQNRMKDNEMVSDWHSGARKPDQPSSLDVRKSFSRGRNEDDSVISKVLSPLARLFGR